MSIVFYGAGEDAKKSLLKWRPEDLIPTCFADTDPDKHFTKFSGLRSKGGRDATAVEYEILPLDEAIRRDIPDGRGNVFR